MIKIEVFILLGILIGVALTLGCQWLYRVIHNARERRMVLRARDAALKVRIDTASTDELLEEISTRDDLSHPKARKAWDPQETMWTWTEERPVHTAEDGTVQASDSKSAVKQTTRKKK